MPARCGQALLCWHTLQFFWPRRQLSHSRRNAIDSLPRSKDLRSKWRLDSRPPWVGARSAPKRRWVQHFPDRCRCYLHHEVQHRGHVHLQGALLVIPRECQKRRCCRAAHQRVQRPVLLLQALIRSQLPAPHMSGLFTQAVDAFAVPTTPCSYLIILWLSQAFCLLSTMHCFHAMGMQHAAQVKAPSNACEGAGALT